MRKFLIYILTSAILLGDLGTLCVSANEMEPTVEEMEITDTEEIEGKSKNENNEIETIVTEDVDPGEIILHVPLPEKMAVMEEFSYFLYEDALLQNQEHPEGVDVSVEIKDIQVSDRETLDVSYDEDTMTWNMKALCTGTVTVTMLLSNEEKEYEIEKEIVISCNHPITVETMQIDAVLGQARNWIGRKESNGSHKEIIDIYNAYTPLPIGYKVKYTDQWCATFVSAVAMTAQYSYLLPIECGCQRMIALFKEMEIWQEDERVTPEIGWIIFYDWDDNGKGDNKGWSDHVGIVEKVEDEKITVIEGNNGGRVKRRTIQVNGRYIRGYGLPLYGNKITQATTSKQGTIVRGCMVCEEREKEVIPAISKISLEKTQYTYDGKIKTPNVKVIDKKKDEIESRHYALTYGSGRMLPGKYKVKVDFNGMYYKGSKNLYFTICPKAPKQVKAALYKDYDDVRISWKKSEGADGYDVYYKKATTKSFVKLATTKKTYWIRKNLSDGVTYQFKVVPYVKDGKKKIEGKASSVATVDTLKAVDRPNVKTYSRNRVKINWADITNESGYQISQATNKYQTKVVLTTSKRSANVRAVRGKTYYYKVRAYKTVSGKRIYTPWSSVRAYKLK